MPQRDPELPEGTDQIIDSASEPSSAPTSPDNSVSGEGGSVFTGLKSQVRDTTQSLWEQAGGRVREYAVDGKDRAASALDELAQAVDEAATLVDRRLGSEYGGYARRAAEAVQGFSDSVREKEVEDLYNDAREIVRKSPALALGTAAALGFALVRLVKAGPPDPIEDDRTGGTNRSGANTGE